MVLHLGALLIIRQSLVIDHPRCLHLQRARPQFLPVSLFLVLQVDHPKQLARLHFQWTHLYQERLSTVLDYLVPLSIFEITGLIFFAP